MGPWDSSAQLRINHASMCTLTLARLCETLRAFLGVVRPNVTHVITYVMELA